MAILVFIGGTSTDGTVLANWVIEGTSSAPTSIATTDTLKFNGDSTQACTLSQGTIGCIVIDTTMNHRVTFTATTLNTDAIFFGNNSEIHMGAVNNVVFSGNHSSQAGMPHQDHNVVFQGTMSWQSNRHDTVFQLDPGSSTTYISNGQFPRVKMIGSGAFSLNPAASVTGTYATAEMITLEITTNITFTNTLLTLGTTKKTLHITSSNYTAGKQFICAATTLDTKNAILRIDAANNQFIPVSHDTTNFGGATFKCNLGDLVLGIQSGPDKIYMANGKALVCDSLEIKKGCVFLGGEDANEASTIKVAARPEVRGTWNFKTLAEGIYRSNGIEPAGGGGGSGTVTSVATTAPITGGTITATGTIGISAATTSAAGSMSSADKTKLDGIAASATANAGTVTAVTGTSPIASSGGATPAISISAATTSAAGSMSGADKSKLDGLTQYTDADAIAALTPLINGNTNLINTNTTSINDVKTKAKVYAYMTGNQSYSSGSLKVNHNAVLYDVGGNYDTTNNCFTAPRDGYYLVTCSYYSSATPTWGMSLIYIDTGSGYSTYILRRPSSNGQDNMISSVVKLDANDKIAHFANQSGSTTIQAALSSLTYFTITEML